MATVYVALFNNTITNCVSYYKHTHTKQVSGAASKWSVGAYCTALRVLYIAYLVSLYLYIIFFSVELVESLKQESV